MLAFVSAMFAVRKDLATARHLPPNAIFLMSYGLEMVRIDAELVLAQMVYVQMVGH